MDVRHLALLRELAERGTVQAVAAATHRTPSAVSQQLRTAQRDIGLPLVEPDGRGLRLTDAGRLLADGAVEVEAAIAGVQARLDHYRGRPSGVVTVAALASAGAYLLPPTCAALAADAITLACTDVDVAETDYAALTADHEIVIGHSLTGARPAGAQGLARSVLAREPIDVALPRGHRLAAQPTVAAADLADEDWVTVPDGYPFGEVRRGVELANGTQVRRVQELRDNRLIESFVAAGLGIGLLPRYTTGPGAPVVLRPLADVPATRWIVALSRPDRARRVVVARVVAQLRAAGWATMRRHGVAPAGADGPA